MSAGGSCELYDVVESGIDRAIGECHHRQLAAPVDRSSSPGWGGQVLSRTAAENRIQTQRGHAAIMYLDCTGGRCALRNESLADPDPP